MIFQVSFYKKGLGASRDFDFAASKRRNVIMGKKLNKDDLVSFRELLVANSIQVDALTQLLIEEGVISEQKFVSRLKQVQAEYKKRLGNA
jgi:hypothetical protein